MRDMIEKFLSGYGFTYAILTMYALRCGSYAVTKHYGPAAYWVCVLGITVSAEFLMRKFP